MDNYSVKRHVNGFIVPRKGSGSGLGDVNEDGNQFCNRLGCKGRLRQNNRVPRSEFSGKLESSPSRASNEKEKIDSSISTGIMLGGNTKKAVNRLQKTPMSFKSETYSSEKGVMLEDGNEHKHDNPNVRMMELGSSSVSSPSSSSNNQKVYRQKSGVGTRITPLVSTYHPFTSRSRITNQGASSGVVANNSTQYGSRNLRCNSRSEAVASGSSSSVSNFTKRKDLVKQRNCEIGSSSLSQGKKMTGQLSQDRTYKTSNHGTSISHSGWGGSVKGKNARTKQFPNNGIRIEFPSVTPPSESFIGMQLPLTSHWISAETAFSCSSSSNRTTPFSRPGSGGCRERDICNPLLDLEGLRQYSADVVEEALLALESIQQDEELTYDEMLALDANVFLGGLVFYDQHRDMRLDIDDMSYEDLLVLEERMGNVSTALSEEAISKYVGISIFRPPRSFGEGSIRGCTGDESEVKCSICQEEYGAGDEVGRLNCDHRYHKICISQWLRLKNWCPICKASAASADAAPSTLAA